MGEWMIHGWCHILSVMWGLVIGSFLNVLVARLPHGKSVVLPRSHCPQCQARIAWYDNIPLLSFLILRAKCRSCQAAISFRYPMIEFLTALLFLAVELKVGWTLSLFLRHWPWVAILIAVTFIDLEHRIIPDALSLGGSLLGLATASLESEIGWRASAFGFVLGFGVFYLMGTLYYRIRGRSGIGGGDIKLLGMIGAFLGVSGVFATVLVSSTLGSGVGIVWALSRKSQSWMNFAIPYGPFLVLGALCYYLLGNQLWFQFMIPI